MELKKSLSSVLLLLAVWGFAIAPAALADAREDYRSALDALDAGDAARARDLLQGAIEENPTEKKPLIGRDYLPHFYLGKALFALGNCRGAMAAWSESQRQGVVEKAKDEFAELQRSKRSCQGRLQEFDKAKTSADAKIDEATNVATRVGQLESDEILAGVWDEGDPSFKTRQFEALRFLWDARNKLRDAEEPANIDMAREAQGLAERTIEELARIESSALQQKQQIEAHRKDLAERLRRAVASARSALDETEESAATAPGIESLRNRLTKLVASASRRTEHPAKELRSLADRIATLSNGLRRATRMPPEELQVAAASYLQGQYPAVVDLLLTYVPDEDRVSSQVCLLLAASLHAMKELGYELPPQPPLEVATGLDEDSLEPAADVSDDPLGEADTSELSEADEGVPPLTALDVLFRCRELDDELVPGETYFSPSFRELFQEFRSLQAETTIDEG